MRPNKLRELVRAGKPTIGTHMHTVTPALVEMIGYTGMYDYVELVTEYAT
jgi:4-hydroxy-2-oxoheptanedioate aldolase